MADKTNLERLQELCNTVNRRYKAGLNDDDQVRRMLDYAEKQTDIVVIIGYDTYHAMKVEDIKKLKTEPAENGYVSFFLSTGKFRAKI